MFLTTSCNILLVVKFRFGQKTVILKNCSVLFFKVMFYVFYIYILLVYFEADLILATLMHIKAHQGFFFLNLKKFFLAQCFFVLFFTILMNVYIVLDEQFCRFNFFLQKHILWKAIHSHVYLCVFLCACWLGFEGKLDTKPFFISPIYCYWYYRRGRQNWNTLHQELKLNNDNKKNKEHSTNYSALTSYISM